MSRKRPEPIRTLERRAEPVEREHVQQQVERPVVQERRRDQPPPLAVRDADRCPDESIATRDEHALLVDRPADAVHRAARRELGDVDERR
jgi:hypothetical protein